MTYQRILRARRRVRHYNTPAKILNELQWIGGRYFWPAIENSIFYGTSNKRCLLESWREHERTARRQLLVDKCAQAVLWDLGRTILLRACELAREVRKS